MRRKLYGTISDLHHLVRSTAEIPQKLGLKVPAFDTWVNPSLLTQWQLPPPPSSSHPHPTTQECTGVGVGGGGGINIGLIGGGWVGCMQY